MLLRETSTSDRLCNTIPLVFLRIIVLLWQTELLVYVIPISSNVQQYSVGNHGMALAQCRMAQHSL